MRQKRAIQMVRKALAGVVPYRSVRQDLRLAESALSSAVRGLCAEWSAGRKGPRPGRNLKLNIGCGNLVLDGWSNLDAFPVAGALYLNAINGLPFPDGSAIHIHCEHFLEHLDYDDAEAFLAECFRVLQPKGSLRIIVPDAGKYIAAYCRDETSFFEQLRYLGNARNPLETKIHVVNQMFRMGGEHKFAWDFETLRHSSLKAGFHSISASSRGDVPPEFAIDGADDWRQLESLYANICK
jgi:predicted SAM-dependent methyltransferase